MLKRNGRSGQIFVPAVAGFPISILVVAGPLLSQWGGHLVQEMGEQLATSGGAVYTSSCQHTEKKMTQQEPWFNAYPSDQGFSNRGGGAFPLSGERWEIFLGENLIYMVVWTWREMILTVRTLFKAKNNIL